MPNNLNELNNKFVAENKMLLNSLPTLTGDSARLAHRLSRATDYIEKLERILVTVIKMTEDGDLTTVEIEEAKTILSQGAE